MKCRKCNREFKDGDHIVAHIMSVYHSVHGIDNFRYALEHPRMAFNVDHLYCGDSE